MPRSSGCYRNPTDNHDKPEGHTYFIVIVTHQFPVVFAISGPGSVVDITIERKVLKTRLLIGAGIQLFPRDWSL
jgi:hypothetical protein